MSKTLIVMILVAMSYAGVSILKVGTDVVKHPQTQKVVEKSIVNF